MPQQIRPIPGFTVREQIAYAGWLKGMSKGGSWDDAPRAIERVQLGGKINELASTLSGGQLRRLGVAQTIIHDSRLILMDEPTAGLDPAQRATFRKLVKEIATTTNVIVSTHQTEDLADLYEWVVVLDEGAVQFTGSVAEFMALAQQREGREQYPEKQAEAAYASLIGRSLQ